MKNHKCHQAARPPGDVRRSKKKLPIGTHVRHYVLPDFHGVGTIIEIKDESRHSRHGGVTQRDLYLVDFPQSGYKVWLRDIEVFVLKADIK